MTAWNQRDSGMIYIPIQKHKQEARFVPPNLGT